MDHLVEKCLYLCNFLPPVGNPDPLSRLRPFHHRCVTAHLLVCFLPLGCVVCQNQGAGGRKRKSLVDTIFGIRRKIETHYFFTILCFADAYLQAI